MRRLLQQAWWAEGVHLRAHAGRPQGRDGRVPPSMVATLDETAPLDDRPWIHTSSTAEIDAHLGDALLQLTAFVHELLIDTPLVGYRDHQADDAGRARFRPTGSSDAQSLWARMAGARGRPGGVSLRRAHLRAVDVTDGSLAYAMLDEADLGGARLDRLNAPRVNADDRNLSGADMANARLHQGRFRRADLRSASLIEADLSAADLQWANLSRANLEHAVLNAADLGHANLSGANLDRADIRGADLTDGNLTDANLVGAHPTPDPPRG